MPKKQKKVVKTDLPKIYKVVVLGDGGVGKSCLTVRMIHGTFKDKYDPTIDDSYLVENLEVDDEIVKFEILDTAGQDEYASMVENVYRSGDAFMFCYGSDSPASRMRITEDLFPKVQTLKIDNPNIPMIVVQTKCDLDDRARKFYKEDADNLAKELRENIDAIETSAKANINVHEAFKLLIRKIKQQEREEMEMANKKKKNEGGGCILV